jgi:hypothetical protein
MNVPSRSAKSSCDKPARGWFDGDLWQADAELHPALKWNRRDGSVVHVGDLAHDGEAEA